MKGRKTFKHTIHVTEIEIKIFKIIQKKISKVFELSFFKIL